MSGDLIWAVVRLLVALPLVLVIAYVVLKYGLARRFATAPGSRRMKLLEQLPLGPKTTISLVMFGSRYYLLAHQDNSVCLVKELDELPELEEVKIGDIVELTPRTIEEYDLLQKTRQVSAGVFSADSASQLKSFAGQALRLKDLAGQFVNMIRPGEKGEKKIEG